MKWRIKYMVDPGDGLVTTTDYEHASRDIVEVASDWMNEGSNDLVWLFCIEAIPPGPPE